MTVQWPRSGAGRDRQIWGCLGEGELTRFANRLNVRGKAKGGKRDNT